MRHELAMHFRALVASALVLAGPVACAQGFSEGVHYKALTPAQPTSRRSRSAIDSSAGLTGTGAASRNGRTRLGVLTVTE
jgi:hypothetical protein